MEKTLEGFTTRWMIRIAITGPESTGKSVLAEQLAGHYHVEWVPEFAREYLATHGQDYTLDDVLAIAMGQQQAVEKAGKGGGELLFIDTELLVTKIWTEHAFATCPPWIESAISLQDFDLYLLCDIDLAWTPDPLREHPHLRAYFFSWYEKELTQRRFPFEIVRGQGGTRLHHAIHIINRRFFSSPSQRGSVSLPL